MTATAPASAPAGTRVSARRAQTRERLLAAATQVFAERGVIGASVEEICEAAGFTRGAFYSNFADKDALVLALIQAWAQAQYAAAERAIAELEATGARLTSEQQVALVLARIEATSRPRREDLLVQQELMLHAARTPALHEPYRTFLRACDEQLGALVRGALEVAGLEFVLPFDQALELLVGAHTRGQTKLLFQGAADTGPLQALIIAITRPRGPATQQP